jgi:hypothetical protein
MHGSGLCTYPQQIILVGVRNEIVRAHGGGHFRGTFPERAVLSERVNHSPPKEYAAEWSRVYKNGQACACVHALEQPAAPLSLL